MPIYNTTVHNNKSYVALIVAKLFVPQIKDTNMPRGWSLFSNISTLNKYHLYSIKTNTTVIGKVKQGPIVRNFFDSRLHSFIRQLALIDLLILKERKTATKQCVVC